jgi:hypothetical protein
MLVVVKLPWWLAAMGGKETVTLSLETEMSELDGEVVVSGEAKTLDSDGGCVKLPPYVPVKNVSALIQNILGPEYEVRKNNEALN